MTRSVVLNPIWSVAESTHAGPTLDALVGTSETLRRTTATTGEHPPPLTPSLSYPPRREEARGWASASSMA